MAQDQNATQTTSTQNHPSSSSSEGELDLQTWSKNQAWHCEACVWHCVAAFEGEIVCKTGGTTTTTTTTSHPRPAHPNAKLYYLQM